MTCPRTYLAVKSTTPQKKAVNPALRRTLTMRSAQKLSKTVKSALMSSSSIFKSCKAVIRTKKVPNPGSEPRLRAAKPPESIEKIKKSPSEHAHAGFFYALCRDLFPESNSYEAEKHHKSRFFHRFF